jgi:hypothetical protein
MGAEVTNTGLSKSRPVGQKKKARGRVTPGLEGRSLQENRMSQQQGIRVLHTLGNLDVAAGADDQLIDTTQIVPPTVIQTRRKNRHDALSC